MSFPSGGGTVPLTSVQYTPVGLNLQFIPRVTFEDEIVLTACVVDCCPECPALAL